MSSSTQILISSVGGSIELLLLSCAGAFLAYSGYFDSFVSTALSKALYNLFIPALVFGSVLETAKTSLGSIISAGERKGDLQDIWVPLATAAVLFIVTAILSFPLTYFIGFNKHEAVRRALFACLFLGNANTMPLIVMQSLCDTFSPIQGESCYAKSMGYASLFMTVVNVVSWTFLFQYLSSSPDNENIIPETEPLLGKLLASNFTEQIPKENTVNPISKALLSPPFLTVLVACVFAIIPGVPEALIEKDGFLRPVLISINILGKVVVPISCMLVGAELYRSFFEASDYVLHEISDEEKLTFFDYAVVIAVRMVLLPFLSRLVFSLFKIPSILENELLSIFILVEFNVPTANNTVIMMTIVAESLPNIGKQLKQDVSKCVFWQFILTPLFLTLNTAAALRLLFPTTNG